MPLLALILFSPLIYFNAKHHCSSFHYQGTRRLAAPAHFSLPYLTAGILLLLTPTVLLGALLAMLPRRSPDSSAMSDGLYEPQGLFGLVFTLAPLSVFVTFSLFHQTKPEWTGPIWLAVLPAIANNMLPAIFRISDDWRIKLSFRLWKPTAWVFLLLGGGLLYYVSIVAFRASVTACDTSRLDGMNWVKGSRRSKMILNRRQAANRLLWE